MLHVCTHNFPPLFGDGSELEKTAAVILAGGVSSRFGQDKGLLSLTGKPLVRHVLDRIGKIANEKIVVVSSQSQAEIYEKVLKSEARVYVDKEKLQGPVVGALTGFENTECEYSLLLPCDTPFISRDVLSLMLELCVNKNAAIPRWPNCYIEPLQAAYAIESALETARELLKESKTDMQLMVNRLRNVRYVSTLVLQQLDPELNTFFNINTPLDLKKAENILKHARR